ncbi:hypothetical protein B7Z17_01870, partial [Candidatus Saccharibacteria bacterium 32-49-10]
MGELKLRLESDLKQAMLARDAFLVETLRGLKASILNEEVAKGKREQGLDDVEIETIFTKEAKRRDEAAGLFTQGGNLASAEKELKQKAVIATYLPEQLSEHDIQVAVDSVLSDMGVVGPKDMGRVIGFVKAKLGTAADGSVIAKLV